MQNFSTVRLVHPANCDWRRKTTMATLPETFSKRGKPETSEVFQYTVLPDPLRIQFRQAGYGFQYESGQIICMDHSFTHNASRMHLTGFIKRINIPAQETTGWNQDAAHGQGTTSSSVTAIAGLRLAATNIVLLVKAFRGSDSGMQSSWSS